MSNGKLLAIRLAIGLGALAVAGKAFGLIGIVLAAPVLGVAIAKPLLEGISDGFTWSANQPLRKWVGRYYEFAGQQIRVLEHKGELWFAADDVISSTGIPAAGDTLLEAKSIPVDDSAHLAFLDGASLEKVLLRHRSAESSRFLLWAQRQVLAPHERKKSGAMVPR